MHDLPSPTLRTPAFLALALLACTGSPTKDVTDTDTDTAGVDSRDPTDSAAPGVSTSLADFCATAPDAYYPWLQRCYGSVGYPDTERERFASRLEERCLHARTGVDADRLGFDGVAATACLAALTPDDCVRPFWPATCHAVFEGKVGLGGACYVEESLVFLVGVQACADGWCDEGPDEAKVCPGACEPWAATLASCDGARCAPEDFCDGSGVCRPRAAVGAPCPEGELCVESATCAEVDGAPTCVELVQEATDTCDARHVCPTLTVCVDARCQDRSALGEPCRASFQCEDDGACVTLDGERVGTCTARAAADAPCGRDDHCQEDLFCAGRGTPGARCAAPPALARRCIDERCADGAFCRHGATDHPQDGTCRPEVEQGGSCLVDGLPNAAACAPGLSCTDLATCQPPGDLDEPCAIYVPGTCTDGLWCSRVTHTCQAPGLETETCNPLWPASCAEGLGCDCGKEDRDACADLPPTPQPTDTCQPVRTAGQPCYRSSECESQQCLFDDDAPSGTPGSCADEGGGACLP